MKKLFLHTFLVLTFLISIAEARNSLLTYISDDNGKTWSQKITEIKNLSTKGAVDPSPILLKNGDILLYVLGSNVTSGDPGKSQPDNTWRMIVARSTDDGKSYEEVGVAYSQKSNMTDPFIVLLPSGEFRLYLSKGASVFSATSEDGISFKKDKGNRSSKGKGGVPGALVLKNGSVILYVCKEKNILYKISKDGMKFKKSGIAIKAPKGTSLCDPSPIVNPAGGYAMAYKVRKPANSKNPKDDIIMLADSVHGKEWTTRIKPVGVGSVPGLVVDSKGVWHIYASGVPLSQLSGSTENKKKTKHKKWMMFRNPPPKIKECFLNFLTSREIKTLAEVGKPDDQILFKKGRQALKNCTKQNN